MKPLKLSPLGNGVPSLVQVVVRVLLLYIMPFCSISEQITLRVCPANATPLKGFILTIGTEGTAAHKQ